MLTLSEIEKQVFLRWIELKKKLPDRLNYKKIVSKQIFWNMIVQKNFFPIFRTLLRICKLVWKKNKVRRNSQLQGIS